MNDSFLRFNGTALRSDLVQLRPNLAAELQATTHQFSSLVRTGRHEPEPNVIDYSEEALNGQASSFLLSPTSKFGRTKNIPEVAVFEGSQSHSHFLNEPRQNCGLADNESILTLPAEHLDVLELAVRDTHSLDAQQFRAMMPDLNIWGSGPSVLNDKMQSGPIVQDLLRTQENLTMYERSFGRHLRRKCLEFAYHLLANLKASEKVRARVFRYSFLYLNREQVMHQVYKLLMFMNTQAVETIESLRNRSQRIIRGPDGQGELVYRPAFGLYPIRQPTGNVSPVAIETASLSATPQSIVELASMEGEWWGPEDIEQYLRERGVKIDQRTSYAEVGVDEISSEHLILPQSPGSMISYGSGQSDTASSATSRQSPTAPPSYSSKNFIPTANVNGSFDSLRGLHNPQIYHQGLTQGEDCAMHIPSSPYPSKDVPLATQTDFYDDRYGYARSGIDGSRIPKMVDTGTAGYVQRTHRRVMTLDMSVLLKEISNKGICLGFSPAFKKTDVDYAISVAMQAA